VTSKHDGNTETHFKRLRSERKLRNADSKAMIIKSERFYILTCTMDQDKWRGSKISFSRLEDVR